MKKSDRMTDVHKDDPLAFAGNIRKPWNEQRKESWKFRGKCHRCQKTGHKAKDCRNDPEEDEAEANTASGRKAVVFMSGKCKENCSRRKITFKLDSGASNHLVNRKEYFVRLKKKLKHPVNIAVAKDDESITAWHKGQIVGINSQGVECRIDDVLYVPDVRANLLSVKKMAEAGVNVSFGALAAEMKYDGDIIGVCPVRGNFYELDIYQEQAAANLCDQARGIEGSSEKTNQPATGRLEQEGERPDENSDGQESFCDDGEILYDAQDIPNALPSQLEHGRYLDMVTMRRSEWERMFPDRHSEIPRTKHVLAGANSAVARRSGSQFRPRDASIPFDTIAGHPDEAPWMMTNSNGVWKVEMHPPDIEPRQSKQVVRPKHRKLTKRKGSTD
ncbi:uncharacterized protein LOC115269235 [Aedes albopictus]|uniref:CCHC-type domain-containing protein n=1 Tax=Aedes albopictus TaxID=7160 RepID=A0ABM1ZM08_AEDAL